MEHVIVEAVLLIPELNAFAATVVHCVSNVHEMLEELAGYAFIGWVFPRKFESDRQHVQTIHAHPARAVRLFEMPAGRKGCGAIEDTNIVKPQEATLKNVHALGVFPIHPPGEI